MCTTTMDKLGELAHENADLLYMYKGLVAVPPICMVDDVLSLQKCTDSTKINAVINAFVELKKLTLSYDKCSRIHVGKKTEQCPELKVHNAKMKDSTQEKYLGDLVNTTGNIKETVADRVAKGYGIVSEIKAILSEIPLGKYKLEVGLQLRQAMLLNGLLYNSEAWHSVTMQDIVPFENLDEGLLRYLLGSHSKAPLEMLYLESGATPIRFVISSRRLNYLQTILKREDEELTKRVLQAQINSPCPGDFIKLIEEDFQTLGISMDVALVTQTSVDVFKQLVKSKIRNAALKYLQSIQQKHTKVNQIKYDKLETQKYLTSPLFSNEETELLYGLRTRTVDCFKANFANMNTGNMFCPLNCWSRGSHHTEIHSNTCCNVQYSNQKYQLMICLWEMLSMIIYSVMLRNRRKQ